MGSAGREQGARIAVPVDPDAHGHAMLGAQPHVARAVADRDRLAGPARVRRLAVDLAVVLRALLAGVVTAQDHREAGLPALLPEDLASPLGRGARGEHQRAPA